MNILYIANPSSIHDHKCISFFAGIPGNRIFVVCEQENYGKTPESILSDYQRLNIILAGSFSQFSFKYFWKTISSVFFLRRLVKKHQINMVHILYTAPNAIWGNFIGKTNFILTTRGSDVLYTIPSLIKRKINVTNFLLFFLLKKAFKKAKIITSTSYFQKDTVLKLFNQNSHVIRSGLDISYIINKNFNSLLPDEVNQRKYILFPRLMQTFYNHELEIDAIFKLNSSLKNHYSYVFIKGNNYDSDYFLRIQKKMMLRKDIHWIILPHLTTDESLSLINYASLVVMVPKHDGTPNSALEAMLLRKPLILGNFTYDEDIFNDSCFRMNSNDPSELAELIHKALENYPENLIETAFQRVIQLADRNKEMKKMKKIYEKIVE